MAILDLKCAEYGRKIISAVGSTEKNKIESMITKALGVLQEDGVYAFALYTKSKSGNESTEKKTAQILFNKAFDILKDDEIRILENTDEDFFNAMEANLSDDLDKLIFAKELLERTLIYARYHAKALDGESTNQEE
ncbi:MAG: hypothetical protein JXB42_02290 [Deltaproteobacteria bacterium]|nr:hypothetical protein [Deltaproteobacteria bacterium]